MNYTPQTAKNASDAKNLLYAVENYLFQNSEDPKKVLSMTFKEAEKLLDDKIPKANVDMGFLFSLHYRISTQDKQLIIYRRVVWILIGLCVVSSIAIIKKSFF